MSSSTFRNLARRLIADRRGNFGLTFGIVGALVIIAAGLAVDGGRAMTSRSDAQNHLDAAVLAASRALSMNEITVRQVESYLQSYIDGTSVNSNLEYKISNVVVDPDTQEINASVHAPLTMTLLGVAGIKTVDIAATARASYSATEAEVAMMFDLTGSMKGDKLEALKQAAKQGISDLLGANRNGKINVRIALIPYSEAVNTGKLGEYVFVETAQTSGPPPTLNTLKKTYAGLGLGNGGDLNDLVRQLPVTNSEKNGGYICASERKGKGKFKDNGPNYATVNRDYRVDACPKASVEPLSSDKSALLAEVDKFTASGSTGGQIGIQWSWYMLSPSWKNYLPASARPASYADQDVRKFLILMTDGEFNTAYDGVPGYQSTGRQGNKAFAHAKKLCKKIKKDGVKVFTIGFQLTDKSAKDLMEECATPATGGIKYFHYAENADDLTAIYKTIAGTIQSLRLTF